MDIHSLIFSDEYLMVLDSDLKITQASKEICQKFQWELHEILHEKITLLIAEEDHEHFVSQIKDLNAIHPFFEFEARAQNRLGECRLFRWRAGLHDAQIYLLGRDFSAEKKRSEDLHRALDRLNLSLSATGMALWEHNFTTGEMVWDERMHAIHGMDPQKYKTTAQKAAFMAEFVNDDNARKNWQRIPELIRRGRDLNMQYRVQIPGEAPRYVRTFGRKLRDPHSHEDIYFGNAWDCTEEVLTEQTLREQEAKMVASTKMAALGEMSGGIAHEINNPLTVIQARSFQLNQLAELNKLEPEKVKQVAESISKTADKIARIIRSLRSFARDGANDPFELFSLKQIIEETLEFCRTRFYNHGVEISVDPVPEDLELECRLVQIEQVLLNLLNNSFDAIQDREEKWIRLTVEDLDDRVAVHVTDAGQGIPDTVVEKMMLPFYTTKEVGKGTGLGLSISNGILRGHHGELVYDRASPHTRLTIYLPKLQPKETTP